MKILGFIFFIVIVCFILMNNRRNTQNNNIHRNLTNAADIKEPFSMTVSEVFSIKDRGIVVTGVVNKGIINIGETIEIVGSGEKRLVTVSGIEISRKAVEQALAGDNIGILLKGITINDVKPGYTLSKIGVN